MDSIFGYEPLIIIPLIGGFIGMAVGLVTIWTQIRSLKIKQKEAADASNQASENRIKEYLGLKLENIENKMNQTNTYFKEWIERIEKEVRELR